MIPASASGLRVTPCRMAPATPSAAPDQDAEQRARHAQLQRHGAVDRAVAAAGRPGRAAPRPGRSSREPMVTLRNATRARTAHEHGEPRPEGRGSPRRVPSVLLIGCGQSPMFGVGRLDRLGQLVQLGGEVAVRVQPVRRPRDDRARLGRLDAEPGRLLLAPLGVGRRRVRPAVPQDQVGLVLVGVLPAEVLPVREARVRAVRVDHLRGPSVWKSSSSGAYSGLATYTLSSAGDIAATVRPGLAATASLNRSTASSNRFLFAAICGASTSAPRLSARSS